MKTFGAVLTIVCIIVLILNIFNGIYGNYEYEKKYESYWNLAVKASTIPQKAEYVDQFVAKIESAGMEGEYDAVFMNTPDNSFDYNLLALKSLQLRLKDIQDMNITSFEYQTAIQQITGQEQDEAIAML